MTLRRRLLPVAALVVAIGASAAGAATAEAGTSASTGAAKVGEKPVNCKVLVGGEALRKGAKAGFETKAGIRPSAGECKKKVAVVGLDTVAAKLGVSKDALVVALKQTEQWVISSGTKPSVAQFEEHLAGQLHVPVSKVTSVFGSFSHFAVKPGA